MNFNIGDTVVKPGLGICKIKAIRKMQVEGKDQQFYVLQSGDVNVLVPFTAAHSGGLRSIIKDQGCKEVFAFLSEPLSIPPDERERPEHYLIDINTAKEELRQRDPMTLARLIKTLFYREKMIDLGSAEKEIYKNAITTLADEIAQYEHTTRQKVLAQIRSTLTAGRKTRKDPLRS